MKLFLLPLCVLLSTVSFSAHAQGKKVVTINPDGSVTVTEPGAPTQNLPPPKINPRRQPPFADAIPQAAEPVPEAPPETVHKDPTPPKKPSVPKKKAAPVKPEREKPLREQILTPETRDVEKPVVTKPEKKAVKKPEAKKSAPAKKPKVKEEPVRKGEPAAPDAMGRADPRYKPEPRKPGPVTPDEAKRIALDIGPPARGVEVYPADYNGRKVFQVVFLTEEGERYVLVDRATGDIVND